MLNKNQKHQLVIEASDILKNNANIIFTDFSGLTMSELSALKKELKKEQCGYKVIKKSLLDFMTANAGLMSADLSSHKGALALAFSSGEVTQLAKILNSFAVSSKKLILLGGFWNKAAITPGEVISLAKLPSREVLLSQLVRLLLSPLTGLAKAIDEISKKNN